MAKVKPSVAKSSKKKTPSKSTRSTGGVSKGKAKSSAKGNDSRAAVQQKTKRPDVKSSNKKKRKEYTDEELGIPKLNMVTPVGVRKPSGKKRGKVFVDDQESMMTLLAMVNAEKEGQIESKVMKARQMEEIRQARQREMDARKEEKKSKLEETKDSLRRKRKEKDSKPDAGDSATKYAGMNGPPKLSKKRVSFV